MGTKHPVGENLFESIQQHYNKDQGIHLSPTESGYKKFYRGRTRKADTIKNTKK